ncbi:MAG TPA: hypothetical protein VFL29_10535 [Candidatus Dormibacteraeota bacterium]|nr:hypothetical protein [Candidatus Dormibacteraeota bacterium]
MAGRPFAELAEGDPSLLEQVERIVLDAHRRLSEAHGRPWSRPIAYRWLRYEDPMPVERLAQGVERLVEEGATFHSAAVDKACAEAVARGFSN